MWYDILTFWGDSIKNYIFILLLFSIPTNAQDNLWTIGIGTSGTTRIIYFPNDNLSPVEQAETINLNSVAESYHFEVGHIFGKSSQVSWRVGSTFSIMRFGIRKYKFPIEYHNGTPQYPIIKRTVVQKQISIFFEPIFKNSILWSKSFFLKSAVVWNYKDYKLKTSSYDDLGHRGFYGNEYSDIFKVHPFDLNIGFGLNYSLFNGKINLQPYSKIFLHPYKIKGQNYIYFEKDTYGILCDFGLNVQYKFRLN